MKEKDNTYRIADMAESERPRERLSKYGTQVLTNAELMAILLRVGVPGENAVELGRRLLDTFGGISGLHRAAFDVVCDEHGMGPAKTAQIKAALEFSVSESGLEDALAEFDELTVEGLLREILDKSIACDDIAVKITEGPNTLEEYDQAQGE